MAEFVKIEAANGRRFNALHVYSQKTGDTLCGVPVRAGYEHASSHCWYVTTDPRPHQRLCSATACKRWYKHNVKELRYDRFRGLRDTGIE